MIKRVAKGEEITITRNGVPVAKLGPPNGRTKMSIEDALTELRAIRRKIKMRGLTIRQMIEEGRRY
jgi:antitoxin (DNA-binding transcriptional repressor) of toxin-antitoxin stability system